MLLFLGLSLGVVGTFFILGFGKLFDAPYWFHVFTSGAWGAFCGGLARYIKDERKKREG
ncbi:hypothetical protein ES702_07672 [subsurface metagenome]